MKKPKGKVVGRFRFSGDKCRPLTVDSSARTTDSGGRSGGTADDLGAEWALIEELPADEFVVTATENGWLIYRRAATEDTFTNDARTQDEQPGKLAALNARMRDFWAKRIARGELM